MTAQLEPVSSQRVQFHRTGNPDVLRFERCDVAPPGDGEILIRQTAIGVNFIDTYHRSGLYPVSELPSGIGVEAVGRIEAAGPGSTEFNVGDRVAYVVNAPGSYAEARVVQAENVVRVPEALSDEEVAGALLKGMTVAYLINVCAHVKRGDTVLWHAAAGGVGLIACQWLAARGVAVIGTVGSPEKAAVAAANGCAHTILYREQEFAPIVRELTQGQGVPVVFDSVGAATFEGSLQCLAPRGLLVSFGNSSGPPPAVDVLRLSTLGSLYLTRPSLFHYIASRQERRERADELFEAMTQHQVAASIDSTFPLCEASEAHLALESRRSSGSIVLIAS